MGDRNELGHPDRNGPRDLAPDHVPGPVAVDTWRHQIEVEFVALPGRVFVFDCQFPDVPANVPCILGIGGDVLRQLTITLDGTPQAPHARYGFVRVAVVDPPHSSSP